MEKLIIFYLFLLASKIGAQCSASISPASASVSCSSYNASFTTVATTSAVSVRHDWYSPLNPGMPMYTSNSFMSTLTNPFVPGVYTVVTTYTSIPCATTNTFLVTSSSTYPSFNASSSSNYSIGCSPNADTLCMINVVSSTSVGVQYKFLPPTSTLSIPCPSFAFGAQSCSVISSQGTWTLVVRDLANGCQSSLPVKVTKDSLVPGLSVSFPTQTLSCSNPTILASASSTNVNTQISWQVPATPSVVNTSTVLFGPPNGPPTSTTSSNYANYTAMVTNTVSGCVNSSVIAVYQNFSSSSNASFTHTVGANGLVNFNNTTSGVNMICNWNFGDGFVATGNPMSHTYMSAGAYNAQLTVNDSGSVCYKTTTLSINVTSAPCFANTNFTVIPTSTAQYWSIIPSYPWNITNAIWSWGDGSSTNGLYSSHSYSAAAVYTICLTATISCGATSTTCSTYFINKGSNNLVMVHVNVVPPSPVTVGVRDSEDENLFYAIFPNPNNGTFNVKMKGLQGRSARLSLYNLVGQMVYDIYEEVYNGELDKKVDPVNVTEGIYFMKVSSGDKAFTKKIMVSK